MTNEEAINRLNKIKAIYKGMDNKSDVKALDMAIKALEQTDGDLISRQAVKDLIRGLTRWCVRSQDGKFDNVGLLYDDVMFGIDRLSSAEKTAEWIKQKSGDELFPEEIVCSKCYHSNSHLDFDEHNNPIGKVFFTSKYCPNCGRRMKKETDGESK